MKKEKSKKWYEYIPIRIHLNITFTKLVGLGMIYTGIRLNNMPIVGWGCGVLVGRKCASYFINK